MFVKRFLVLFIATLLGLLTVYGQTPSTPPQDTQSRDQKQEEAQAKLDSQAFDLLEAVIKDIQRLRLAQNRATLSVTAGDLIWQHDEKAGRALFKDAMADLRAMLSEPAEENGVQANRQRIERGQLRERVLFALARHDSKMALELLAETRPPLTTKDGPQGESEVELETRLAAIIAENDPTHALEMARASLAKGFSNNLPTLLSEIQQKDPSGAADLAADILTKLKSVSLSTNQEAGNLAVRIFQMATERPQPKTKSSTKEVKPLLSEQSLRELAELIVSAALVASPEDAGRQLDVGSIMTGLEKYAPSRTQQLRRKNGESGQDKNGERGESQDYAKLIETGNSETLIAAAETASPGMREVFYGQAAMKLVEDDKVDQARQLITAHISDPYQRQAMLADIDKQVLTAAAAKGKMEEIRKLMATASNNEERIAILTQLATAVAEKGNKKVALQILEEARNLSVGRTRYSRQLLARLQVARAYAAVDPAQSLAILEPTIDQLNELIAAGIVLGEFLGEEEFVVDDEVVLLFVSQMADLFQQQFGKDLALLSKADFARTRDAADKFQRFEVRIMARLLVVQSVLIPVEDKAEEFIETNDLVKPIAVAP